jgi:hypothetical protein
LSLLTAYLKISTNVLAFREILIQELIRCTLRSGAFTKMGRVSYNKTVQKNIPDKSLEARR